MYESTFVKIPSFWWGLKRPAWSGRAATSPAENAASTRSGRTQARLNRIMAASLASVVLRPRRADRDHTCHVTTRNLLAFQFTRWIIPGHLFSTRRRLNRPWIREELHFLSTASPLPIHTISRGQENRIHSI